MNAAWKSTASVTAPKSAAGKITLHVGYSNPVAFDLPEGITATVEKNNNIKLFGIDKQKLGLDRSCNSKNSTA